MRFPAGCVVADKSPCNSKLTEPAYASSLLRLALLLLFEPGSVEIIVNDDDDMTVKSDADNEQTRA
jgi:hypothetical protein